MSFIGKENVDNLHKFIATQIRQKINVDIELEDKYKVIINNLVERIHSKKNKNFDKSVTELNKIAIDSIVPFLVKTIEKTRTDNIGTVDRKFESPEQKIEAQTVDYSRLGNNNVSGLDNSSEPSMFNLSSKMMNHGSLLGDSSVYDDRLSDDNNFFEKNLQSSELKQPDLSKEVEKRQVVNPMEHDKANLVDTYDAKQNMSATVAEHERQLLGVKTEGAEMMSLKTELSTAAQTYNKENKMMVLDLYGTTVPNDNGGFNQTSGIKNIICTLQQPLVTTRPCEVFIEYIMMHNLIGSDSPATPFELFHSFALSITELNINNYSNLSPYSGKFIIPNELYGLNDKGEGTVGSPADATSYVLRLKSNFVCRIEPKRFARLTISLEGLSGNNSAAATQLTTITSPSASTGVAGLTWTFTNGNNNINAGQNHNFADNDRIIFTTVPNGNPAIPANTLLFIINSAAQTIQLSTTRGGTALAVTGTGTTSSYTVGSVFTDSRLQVGLFFREL